MTVTDDEEQGASAHVELVDQLPGGRTVHPVEIEGELVWLVLKSEMSERACAEMNEYLRFITRGGLWVQNWEGDVPPPTRLRSAS